MLGPSFFRRQAFKYQAGAFFCAGAILDQYHKLVKPGGRILVSAKLIGIFGGLIGAIATLGLQAFGRFRNRPILGICFLDNEPGCAVTTPGWRTDAQGALLRDAQGNPRIVQQRYLRLKIVNSGETFAQNTSVCVTRITFRGAGAGAVNFEEEVFELKLALTRDRTLFLASKGHRFVDLAHTQQEAAQPVELVIDFVNSAARLGLLGFGIGQYELNVFVAAENAQSVSGRVRWSWNGTLNGLTIDT
jgi:hypothetical protein